MRAEWLGEFHVSNEPMIEKCADAPACAIDNLIADDQVPRSDLFDKAAGRATGENMRDAQLLERENVRAIRHRRRVEQMTWSMPREKRNINAFPAGEQDRAAGWAERCLDVDMLAAVLFSEGFAKT